MKFAIVAVIALALTMGAQSSVIPWGVDVAGHGLSYTAVSNPVAVGPWGSWGPWGAWGHGPVVVAQPPAAVTVAQSSAHIVSPAVVGPAAVVAHAPAVVAVAPAHEGSYVAKTRGAIHSAPLSGHVQSVASVNVQPAPGTV